MNGNNDKLMSDTQGVHVSKTSEIQRPSNIKINNRNTLSL